MVLYDDDCVILSSHHHHHHHQQYQVGHQAAVLFVVQVRSGGGSYANVLPVIWGVTQPVGPANIPVGELSTAQHQHCLDH